MKAWPIFVHRPWTNCRALIGGIREQSEEMSSALSRFLRMEQKYETDPSCGPEGGENIRGGEVLGSLILCLFKGVGTADGELARRLSGKDKTSCRVTAVGRKKKALIQSNWLPVRSWKPRR